MMQRIFFFFIIITIILSACNSVNTLPPQVTEMPPPTKTPPVVSTPTALPQQNSTQSGQISIACKNSLSDAALINTAITNSAVGVEIVISGNCLINQTIKLLGDRSYRGTSRTGTVLKQADGANLVALLASDTFLENREWTGTPISIRQMTLDGNSKKNQQAQTDGIILRSWASVIEDMYITDMSQDGIRVAYKSADGTKLTTSQVNGIISGNFINDSGRYAVSDEFGITDWYLTYNEIAFSGVDGIHLEDVAGWFIEHNNVYQVPHNGIYAEHLFGTSISDNYIEGFGETTQTGNWYGIYATIQGGAASTISNNRIFNIGLNVDGIKNPNSVYRYLALTVNYETGVVSVIGNTIRGTNTGNEIGLYYTGGNHRLIVTSTGNAVVDITGGNFIDNRVTLSAGE